MKKFLLVSVIVISILTVFISNVTNANVQSNETVAVSFADKNMYNKVRTELETVVKEADDSTYTIKINSNDLNNITRLSLKNGQITNISGIENFTALTELDLSQNIISNVTSLRTLVNLETLNLYDNVISDLSGLENMTKLTVLKLGENNEIKKKDILNVSVLNNLTNLRYLDFSENFTNNIIDNIDKLVNLEFLNLEQNKITEISKLSNFTNLKMLNLYNNSIIDITPLYSLKNLEELVLQSNKITSLDGILDTNNELVWINIRKLDIARNKIDTVNNRDIISNLCSKSINGTLELNYENIINTSNLPHYDSNGTPYVTYDDFGARCDGVYDDFIAIRNAHNFANKSNCEVRATQGKTYHIFKFYEDAVDIKTNVDWNNATFIIHDENIEECSGKTKYLFWVNIITNEVKIENPNWTIGKSTKEIPEIKSVLSNLNAQGYKQYFCAAINTDKKQYIRYGMNANAGDDQQDYFIIDSNANVLDDIIWDFEKLTSFIIYPISDTKYEMKNGNFITNAFESKTETPYTRLNSGKPIYYLRSIGINKCANIEISKIKHTLSADDLSGSYYGFIYARNCANININNCEFFNRKYAYSGRSTYDLMLKNCVNLNCKNIVSNSIYDADRWSTLDVSYSKNILFENCTVNKIGTHQGVYNVTVKNCEVGSRALAFIGQGDLNIINTNVTANEFINLREDYGSTWNGNINIVDCTYKYMGIYAPKIFNFRFNYDDSNNTQLHDFGYECRFPNVYIDNLTIDFENVTNTNCVYFIPNFASMLGNPYNGNADYWPHTIYINGYKFINDTRNSTLKLSVSDIDKKENTQYNYVIMKDRIKGDIDYDGEVTINDLAKLKLHLIEKELLTTENQLKAADVDGDGIVTINDLARMKLIIIGTVEEVSVENTSFDGYEFTQITPDDRKVTYERVVMTSKDMLEYGSTGAGSQWPISMETSKDGELMLLGTDVAGMYKSTDHGQTWSAAHSGFETRGVGMFAIDPYNNDHILALGISKYSGNGGIYETYDQATIWNKTFKFTCRGIRYLWDGLEFDPTTYSAELGITTDVYFSTPYRRDTDLRMKSTEEPDMLSELADNEVGLYKSTDGGKTFNIIINDKKVADGIIKITDNGKIYIGNQHGLFTINKVTNTIEEFIEFRNDATENYAKGVTGLDVVGNVIYVQTWDGIYTVTEDGTITKITTDTYTTDHWAQFLEVSEKNPNYMIYMYRENVNNPYSIGVKVSKDAGKTWTESRFIVKSSFYRLDGRGREKVFIMDPTDENNIITFAGYNLERSKDGGLTFAQVAGLSNTMQGGRFNFNYYNPDLMLFSAQDYTGTITTDGGEYYNALKIEGKGNIYGGFAADEKTYFGFANETWWGGTLTVTHDGGKSWKEYEGYTVKGVPGTPYYSSMQSYTDPNVLFAAQYYSKDKGYTWQEMNGCVAVLTINYTGKHEIYGGDKDGNLVVSYDNGDTWKKLNSQPFLTSSIAKEINIIDIAYDQVNNYAYVLLNMNKTDGKNEQHIYKYDISNDISTEVIYPREKVRGFDRTKTIAIDPNSVNVLYVGGSGDYFCSALGLIRSIDGGETWQVLTTANDERFEAHATNQGGYEVTTIRVNPIDGKAWISCGCYGYETIDPPYDSSLLKHKQKIEHTIKYVYNGNVIKEETIGNGKMHDYTYLVDGLEFVDWYTDKEFTNSFSNGSNVYNSMVLYAKMVPSKKIELYVNDKIFKQIDLDKFDEGNVELIPKKDGYAFAGWFYDKELTNMVNIEEITDSVKLYAGWYKVEKQVFDPNADDMAVYIAFADQKLPTIKMIDNNDFIENRSIHLGVDKNSSYLITFKMDTRFRIGMAKTQFKSYSTVSEYYINEFDNNGAVPVDKYVYKIVDTKDYTKMLVYYYTHTGSRDFMDIKNTFKIYKLESKDLIYEV